MEVWSQVIPARLCFPFQMILENNPASIPDLGRKLALVANKEFLGLNLYNDALCDPSRVKKATIY